MGASEPAVLVVARTLQHGPQVRQPESSSGAGGRGAGRAGAQAFCGRQFLGSLGQPLALLHELCKTKRTENGRYYDVKLVNQSQLLHFRSFDLPCPCPCSHVIDPENSRRRLFLHILISVSGRSLDCGTWPAAAADPCRGLQSLPHSRVAKTNARRQPDSRSSPGFSGRQVKARVAAA